jgi:hypothetical protein
MQTSDTQEKRFELETDAEADWQYDIPYLISEDISLSS